MNAWYAEALQARLSGQLDDAGLDALLRAIREYERMLAHEYVLQLKFWIHLSKEAQKKRLAELDRKKTLSWQVTDGDWNHARLYSKSHDLWEHTLRETSTGEATWYVVEGTGERYRDLTVGGILLDSLTRANLPSAPTERNGEGPNKPAAATPAVIDNVKLIRGLDLTQKIDSATYAKELERLQRRLAHLTQHKRFRGHLLHSCSSSRVTADPGGRCRSASGQGAAA